MRFHVVLPLALLTLLPSLSRAQVIVPWSARTTVDTDGDLTPDVFDNAPGLPNNQADLDNDAIGDPIDPTPTLSNPYLGDPGLGLTGPYTIPAGTHASIDYLVALATPPGSFGHIDLDLDNDGSYDATYFGPLTPSLNTIDIPPSLFSSPLWDLNTPGSYTLHAKAFAPGMSSQFDSITTVTVLAPEPASLSLLAFAPLALRRHRRTSTIPL